jgi:hypothetical protein
VWHGRHDRPEILLVPAFWNDTEFTMPGVMQVGTMTFSFKERIVPMGNPIVLRRSNE